MCFACLNLRSKPFITIHWPRDGLRHRGLALFHANCQIEAPDLYLNTISLDINSDSLQAQTTMYDILLMELFEALSNGFYKEMGLLFRHRLATWAADMIDERAFRVPRQNVYVFILFKVVAYFEKVRVLSHLLQGLELTLECRYLLWLSICGNAVHSKEVSRDLMANNAPLAHWIVWENVLHMWVLAGSQREVLSI